MIDPTTATASPAATVRVCVFGPAPAADWLAGLAASVPADARVHVFGMEADRPVAADVPAALRAAVAQFPRDDVILLRSGTRFPRYWFERIVPALRMPDVLVASPLDNADPSRAPLPPGQHSDADIDRVDALCHACGHRDAIDWPGFSPLLSAWRGEALAGLDLDGIRAGSLPPAWAPRRSVVLDHVYVADPDQPLRGPQPDVPGADPAPLSALGELREAVAAALASAERKAAYPGLDGKAVVLHVLHGWGGGAERFVRDLAAADSSRHHLILTARGNFARRCFGEVLELLDGTPAQPPLRQLHLSDPIASTRLMHRAYAEFLGGILRDYAVDAVVVSSLIGHSLDALRTGLPTTYFIHDFYPLWPLLHRNLDDDTVTFDAAQLTRDLAGADAGFEFAERDPGFWLALREAFADSALAAQARLIAPSRSALALFLKLQPRLTALRQVVVPHGTAPWPSAALPLPAPPVRERLRLIVLGRVRRGKAAHLLREMIPQLREHAELFLLGAGPESSEFFGESGVHILLNYRHDELPDILRSVAADAALILPNFAETFSYTLSELFSFGIPVIATRLGALGERIQDGSNGFLVAPTAADVIATVARLRSDRSVLDRVRAELEQTPPRTLVQMAADYRDLLPLASHHASDAPATIGMDRTIASTRAAVAGSLTRENSGLRARIAKQERELAKRGEWGFELDAQLKRTGKALRKLHEEFEERSAWALKLDAELDRVLGSASWRITRPLRDAMRKLRALRARLHFATSRLRAIWHRTRGSLASRGVAGTIRRAADEFRRNAPLAPVLLVAPPSEDFAPFAVPASAQPRVSIVIPAFNKIAYTVACLRSLAQHPAAAASEVIVVDDASTDATAERLAQVRGIRVVRNAQNLGFVGSCNAGVAAATGEFIAFLNNDTVVTSGWLDAMLACFAEEPDAGLVGAKLVYPDGRLQEAGGIVFRDGSGWNYGRFDDPAEPRYNFRREADYCSGAAILVRRETFAVLGGFDTRYAPAYYEDTDLAFAVRAAGKKVIYEPRAMVVHFEGVTAGTDTASGMKRFQTVNRGKFVEKWTSALARQPESIRTADFAPAAANWRATGRVLIVDAYTPTPDQDSGSLRMLNVMRLLRESGYAVSFLPDNRAHSGRYTEAIQALGVEALYHPYVADPIAWLRIHGAGLDAILLSRHYVATNYIGLARLYAPQARLIFDTVDVHHLRERRAAELEGSAELAEQAARTHVQEVKLMRECDVTLVVSAAEKDLLQRELPQVRFEILSNVHAVHGRRHGFAERRDLVFLGGFQHPPNVDAVLWFVREVFPRVRARLPDVTFHVIGSKAPPQILELAHDGVVVHGYVEDIAPFMDGCRLALAPLRYGAGVKGKVNMAMSCGLPVVATTPAVEGMHARNGEDVLIADLPADFAAAIVRAYGDADLWKKLSDNGLANVSRHFSFDAARAALARILPPRRQA
jgi:O-antigen biosynthesis protein